MYEKKDHYHKKAKAEGFLARSAYKLQEIQKRFKVIHKADQVLDLGCAPGAWLQVALKLVGNSGKVWGIDLEVTKLSDPRLSAIQADIFDFPINEISNMPFQCILSDMAPKTSGVRVKDEMRSLELARQAYTLGASVLAIEGNMVLKIFEGADTEDFFRAIKPSFHKLERFRPESTRQGSRELYLIGLKFKKRSPN